jgi:hypothetical protein
MEIRQNIEGYKPDFYLPPWVQFPEEEPHSMFWSMGKGETYLGLYWGWLESLPSLALKEYKLYYNPPIGWDSYK